MSKSTDRANVENRAMRNVLELMGFDTERLIRLMTDNEQAQWMRATFGGVTVQIDAEKMQQTGTAEQTIASLEAILSGLRKPEGNHV